MTIYLVIYGFVVYAHLRLSPKITSSFNAQFIMRYEVNTIISSNMHMGHYPYSSTLVNSA